MPKKIYDGIEPKIGFEEYGCVTRNWNIFAMAQSIIIQIILVSRWRQIIQDWVALGDITYFIFFMPIKCVVPIGYMMLRAKEKWLHIFLLFKLKNGLENCYLTFPNQSIGTLVFSILYWVVVHQLNNWNTESFIWDSGSFTWN